MAFTNRGKKIAYDNIASGSATGRERVVAGDTVSVVAMPGGGYRTSTSTGEAWHSNVAVGSSVTDTVEDGTVDGGAYPENIIKTATTMTLEKLG